MQNDPIKNLIHLYNLKPHVEGGFAQLLYEDECRIKSECLPNGFQGDRAIWNAIYYLLPKGSRSILHRIKMDELWNFYLGEPLELFDISPAGELKKVILGQDLSANQRFAYVFPKNHWIGALPQEHAEFSFVSCVTSPGFTFADWEKGDYQKLSEAFPHLQEVIKALT